MMNVRCLITAMAVLAASLCAPVAQATSLGINFAAGEPNASSNPGVGTSFVTGPAGVNGTDHWNNVTTSSGSQVNLNKDVSGTSTATTTSVTWSSNNTWSSLAAFGETTNTAAPGGDRDLMTGYLDTSDTSTTAVDVTGLDSMFTNNGYKVIVYIQSGSGLEGDYSVNDGTTSSTLSLVNRPQTDFDGTFTEGTNYLVFEGLTGSSFALTSTPNLNLPGAAGNAGDARAPINGIEIVATPIPEPTALALVLLGSIGFAGIRWTRRKSS